MYPKRIFTQCSHVLLWFCDNRGTKCDMTAPCEYPLKKTYIHKQVLQHFSAPEIKAKNATKLAHVNTPVIISTARYSVNCHNLIVEISHIRSDFFFLENPLKWFLRFPLRMTPISRMIRDWIYRVSPSKKNTYILSVLESSLSVKLCRILSYICFWERWVTTNMADFVVTKL